MSRRMSETVSERTRVTTDWRHVSAVDCHWNWPCRPWMTLNGRISHSTALTISVFRSSAQKFQTG